MSEPRAAVHIPAATAAAEPPDDPPATRVESWGLRTGPNAEFSVEDPMAYSSILVLPMRTASSASNRSMTVA
ncbi:MAG: hypothetical protein BWY83_02469 [bacterium ADurb.Bin478]|nr:MAG: hypothetical protein BWY83_02469 [bacterium ADurb.Bin478]